MVNENKSLRRSVSRLRQDNDDLRGEQILLQNQLQASRTNQSDRYAVKSRAERLENENKNLKLSYEAQTRNMERLRDDRSKLEIKVTRLEKDNAEQKKALSGYELQVRTTTEAERQRDAAMEKNLATGLENKTLKNRIKRGQNDYKIAIDKIGDLEHDCHRLQLLKQNFEYEKSAIQQECNKFKSQGMRLNRENEKFKEIQQNQESQIRRVQEIMLQNHEAGNNAGRGDDNKTIANKFHGLQLRIRDWGRQCSNQDIAAIENLEEPAKKITMCSLSKVISIEAGNLPRCIASIKKVNALCISALLYNEICERIFNKPFHHQNYTITKQGSDMTEIQSNGDSVLVPSEMQKIISDETSPDSEDKYVIAEEIVSATKSGDNSISGGVAPVVQDVVYTDDKIYDFAYQELSRRKSLSREVLSGSRLITACRK